MKWIKYIFLLALLCAVALADLDAPESDDAISEGNDADDVTARGPFSPPSPPPPPRTPSPARPPSPAGPPMPNGWGR
ncbi:formin-like protein 2 isoform X1 [Drosophila sulfurigaster albostrigata]|uniref:formin-like protein 2 n=1 Tax=Drosophila nasuta TaxID=42062 RepID=UPI00295EF195|nr:formin-like protein 2 [Drosophila nasuta]XP_062131090.1 formin-like protein 2 isoform X1 [Drosophila sulfurigaster albostrigata]